MAYYCHACALALGLLDEVRTSDPFQSAYQYEKFDTHTKLSTSYTLQSIFTSPSTDDYGDYSVRAGSSGAVEIDSRGRRNLIVLAAAPTGVEYRRGAARAIADAVKVVLSSGADQVHAYPYSFAQRHVQKCDTCGSELST